MKYCLLAMLLFVLAVSAGGDSSAQYSSAADIALDIQGNIYAVDPDNENVQKFDPSGKLIAKWDLVPQGDKPMKPTGITVDLKGNVYVTDWFGSIQKFSPSGEFVSRITPGGEGLFTPEGIVVDAKGNMYVIVSFNDQIWKLDPSGNPLAKWGSSGSGPGQFTGAKGIIMDRNGFLYLADSMNDRVQKFTSAGKYLASWEGKGIISHPKDLAVDAQGNVYVLEEGRLQEFDSSGKFLKKLVGFGHEDGSVMGSEAVAIDRNGDIYIADNVNARIQKFDPSGKLLARWDLQDDAKRLPVANGNPAENSLDQQSEGGSMETESSFDMFLGCPIRGIASDASSNLYAADMLKHQILKLDTSGKVIGRWGKKGTGKGEFSEPCGVAVDADGNVYVSEAKNARIQKFDPSGKYITEWGIKTVQGEDLPVMWAIAADADGNVYLVDSFNSQIQKFDSSGKLIAKFGSPGEEKGQFILPAAVTVDGEGNTYVVDQLGGRIQKFNSSGKYLADWGAVVGNKDQTALFGPIAVDKKGNVYALANVAWMRQGDKNDLLFDTDLPRLIQKYDSSGKFITQWQVRNVQEGEGTEMAAIGIDAQGNVYVSVWGIVSGARIQKFDSSGKFIAEWQME